MHPCNDNNASEMMTVNWQQLREQLLAQWRDLQPAELDHAGPHRTRIAHLISHKCGIPVRLIENYLHHFERTMPITKQL